MSGDSKRGKYLGLHPLPPDFARVSPPIAEVEEEGCIACDRCLPLCFFDAIVMEDRPEHPYKRVAIVVPENCTGCGLCFEACPVNVIVWVPGPVKQDVAHPQQRGMTTKGEYESF